MSLGTWFNIPVRVHWSWLILAILFCFNKQLFLLYLATFGIVLLHEFAHCFAAFHCGVVVHGITLYPIGGAAQMGKFDRLNEVLIALAGPLLNIAIIPILWMAQPNNTEFFNKLIDINYSILFFNLIPSYPLDGGRALRGVLALFLNDSDKATNIAINCSFKISLILIVFGIFSNPVIATIGVILAIYSYQEKILLDQKDISLKSKFLQKNQIDSFLI